MKRQKGITLIALVITILILLILAGVTITMLTGENGILNQGTKSVTETYHATVKEQIILGADEYFTAKNMDGYKENVIKYLLNEKSYIAEVSDYYRVDVEKVASTVKTGKGKTKAEGDIYVIEQENTASAKTTQVAATVQSDVKIAETTVNTKYVLRYYEKESKSRDLLYLYANGTIKNPDTNPDPDPGPEPEIPDPDPEIVTPSGDDTVISYVEDLVNLQKAVNGGDTQSGKKFILNNDLDFTDINSYDPADSDRETLKEELTTNGFTPIGNSESNQYEGEFYGNGHTIKNITIKTSPDLALFLYNKGTISSLIIETNNITVGGVNPRSAASFALYNNGTITKCINKSELKALGNDVAGITVYNNGTVTECKNEGNITGSTYTAGIIARNNSTTEITNCKNTGTITAMSHVAGIIASSNESIKISNCSNDGNIDGGIYTAGIIAINSSTTDITNCKNTGTITASSSYVGGIVGSSVSSVKILNCSNEGNIISNYSGGYACCGGILGDGNGTIEKCTNNSTINAQSNNIGGIAGRGTLIINDCSNKGSIEAEGASHVGGILGSPEIGAITINKCNNSANIQGAGQCVGGILGNTASSKTSGITSCYNTGNIESNLDSQSSGGIVGQIGYDGLTIDSCYNNGNINSSNFDYVGGIVGYGYAEFSMTNVYNTGEVSGNSYTGGIVGLSNSSSSIINKVYNKGKVIGNGTSEYTGHVGGIVGEIRGNITNAYNMGDVLAEKTAYIGGISGLSLAKIENAQNSGNVTGNSYVGGIVGYLQSTINNTYNSGTITGNSNAGIVIGWTNSGAISSEKMYYLSSLSGDVLGTYAGPSNEQAELTEKMEGKTENEMKSQTFVELLNSNKENIEKAVNWKLDSKTGYPILDFTVTI